MFSMNWIEDGLRFSCGQCGNCCTGSPGYVWMTVDEMKIMALELAMEFDDFTSQYIRKINESYSLIEKANGDCVFWKKHLGCLVYKSRPIQCKTYPFWPEITNDRKKWKLEAKECLGIKKSLDNNEGYFYTKQKISDNVELSKKNDPLQQ